jgi:hypothetical protein
MKDMGMLLKKKKGSSMSDNEKNAKMSVLHHLKGQAEQAMGENLKTFKVKSATPAKGSFGGPGSKESPTKGSVAGESDGSGPGDEHPGSGTLAGKLGDFVGESHPESGSVAGESEGEGPGEMHVESGTDGMEYDDLSVEELQKRIEQLMQLKKAKEGK